MRPGHQHVPGTSHRPGRKSWDAAFVYAEAKDVVIVAAAGNRETGSEPGGAPPPPSRRPGRGAAWTRTATASVDSSSQGISIGVSAPAEALVGGLPAVATPVVRSTGAAPMVAGVAALIRAKYPKMSAPQVINRIISTARRRETRGGQRHLRARHPDARAALSADVPLAAANPMDSITDWIRVHRRGQRRRRRPPAPPSTATPAKSHADRRRRAAPPPDAARPAPPRPSCVLGSAGLLVAGHPGRRHASAVRTTPAADRGLRRTVGSGR